MPSYFSHVRFFVTLQTVACQAPLSVGFSRQKYWSGLPTQRSNPRLFCLLHLHVSSLQLVPSGKPQKCLKPVEMNAPNPEIICCLSWFQTLFCLRCQVTLANLLQILVAYGLLTVQLEVGWWSDRPTISWWNQDLHACPWIENPPSHPSQPGFPRLTLRWPRRWKDTRGVEL